MYTVEVYFVSESFGGSVTFHYVTNFGRDEQVIELKQDDGTEIMIPLAQIAMVMVKEGSEE